MDFLKFYRADNLNGEYPSGQSYDQEPVCEYRLVVYVKQESPSGS